jgi:dynein heavy chain
VFRKDVEAFLAKDSQLRLMLYAENGRDYAASLQPPGKYKKKAMFFVKMEPCALTPENIAEKVTYGDTGDAPLETLSAVAQNVFLPLLTSPNNQVGWPDVLSKEVSDSLHKFTANIFVTIGQAKGHTMLPLPAGVQFCCAKGIEASMFVVMMLQVVKSCPYKLQILSLLQTSPNFLVTSRKLR